jgi:hypothetical protein
MSEDVQGFRFRASPRVPFSHEVRLRFDRIGGSVSGTTADLSTEGMFVATGEYKPIGTLVQFEFENDAGETIQGLADIVWIREVRQGVDREPGMGLHFRYVDPRSRELIAAIVRDLRVEKEEVSPASGATATPASPAAAPPSPFSTTAVAPQLVARPGPEPAGGREEPPQEAPAPGPEEPPTQEQEAPSLASPARTDWPLEPPSRRDGAASPVGVVPAGRAPAGGGPAGAGGAPAGGAVWAGSDDWLRPEPSVDERTLLPRAGGAARRRSRRPVRWLLAVLLLLLAGAAGIAYYRLQSGADARAGAPQPARVGEGPGSVAPEPAGDTPGVASTAETTGGGDTAGVDAADAAGSAPAGVDSAEAVSAEPAREGEGSPAGASGPTASTPPQEPALATVVEPLPPGGALRVSSETGASATVVRISAPWEFGEGAIRSFRLENPPRFVVQV